MSEVETRPFPIADGTFASGRKGRRVGVNIKPGTVKLARKEAGLSLAQVANGAVSRTAIYFVEVGKAKPSMETLRLIAERTGRPLDYFLAEPSTLEPRSSGMTSEIEHLLATGDLEAAVKAGYALLEQKPDRETAARIKHLVAHGHLRLAQAGQGRALAASAREHFEMTGDHLMTAECLGHEASAAYLVQDPTAMGLALRGLELCRTLRPVPRMTESRLLSVLASVHVTNQDWQAAIDCYEQALATGGVVQDLRRLSLIYSGLSQCYGEVGELNQAAHYAQRALAIHETLNDKISLARSENNLGLLMMRNGQVAEAESHVVRALALFEADGVETGKASILTSLCELSLARSQLDEAERFCAQAFEVAERMSEPASVAAVHIWLGRIAVERGDDARVDSEFRQAWEILEAVGSGERLSSCHAQYAEILEQRGELASANHHLRLAITHLRRPSRSAPAQQARIASA